MWAWNVACARKGVQVEIGRLMCVPNRSVRKKKCFFNINMYTVYRLAERFSDCIFFCFMITVNSYRSMRVDHHASSSASILVA